MVWAFVSAWDFFVDPIREQTAATLLSTLTPLTLVVWVFAFRKYRDFFRLNPRRLARRIENSNTNLNDLLVTAADLEERENIIPNPIEQHVLESAEQKLSTFDWNAASIRWPEKAVTVGTAGAIALLTVLAVLQTDSTDKFFHFLRDQMTGSPTGLTIGKHPKEVPVGTDTTVVINVNRWEKSARVQWRDENGTHNEPVVIDTSGKGEFTFYSMGSLTKFRFLTPSLQSKWHTINAYEPARIDSIHIEISPPPYTRLESTSIDQITDLNVPEGSELSFLLQSKAALDIQFQLHEDRSPVDPLGEGFFNSTFIPRESGAYRFLLIDSKGREEKTPPRDLKIIPDLPPTVEILEPVQDQVLAPDETFLLSLYSADDYGLADAQVHLKLSNSEKSIRRLSLHDSHRSEERDPILQSEIREGISLEELGASDGEFLALHVEISDNREPSANRTRSDLLFIEIRTPIPPEEVDGMPMDQKQINLRELIDEQKRILRETYRLESILDDKKSNRIPELISALSALGVEINRIFNEIREDLSTSGGTDLINLFVQADESNQQAISKLEAELTQESFDPQSITLSNLLKLENAFRQNMISKNPAEGGGEGDSESQSESTDGEGEKEGNQSMEKLLEAKQSLDSMVSEQNQLNTSYDRAARSEWGQEAASQDAADQSTLAEQSGALSKELSQIRESGRLRSMLSEAHEHMSSAASNAGDSDATGSLRSGLRARESLRRAATELDTMIAEASGQQLAAAAQTAARLAEQQAQAAKASGNAASGSPSQGELASMEEGQRALQEAYEDFLKALEQQARASESYSPEASQALAQAASQGRSESTASDMERAANALLYGQPAMASPLQSSAAQELANLSDALSEAHEELGNNPMARARALNRQLMAALEELASYARDPEGARAGRLDQIRKDWTQRLDELKQISDNPRFGDLAGRLARANPSEGRAQLAEARVTLQESARLLNEFLFNEESLSGMQINREAAPPPAEYRSMVEEYFRRLANEPSTAP